MTWSKIKTVFIVAFIIIAAETIKQLTGVPITLVDMTIFPLTCLLTYFMRFYTLPFNNNKNSSTPLPPVGVWQLIGFVFFALILTILGVWIAWAGIKEPMHYFSSVKGGAHGYTLIQLGIITTLYSVAMGMEFLYRLVKLVRNQL